MLLCAVICSSLELLYIITSRNVCRCCNCAFEVYIVVTWAKEQDVLTGVEVWQGSGIVSFVMVLFLVGLLCFKIISDFFTVYRV